MALDDAVAVVTGGAGGIGSETAHQLADAGASVVVADVDESGAAETADSICSAGGEATAVGADVTDPAAVEAMVATAVDTYGSLDVAVNNAAVVGERAPVGEYQESEWARVIDVNLSGVWRCCKHELPAIAADGGGAVVNVSSVLGRAGYRFASAYVAAKHGVVGLTRTAAQEYADDGVRVNAICPGFTETSMLEESGVRANERTESHVRGLHPVGRFGTPAEIAAAITWLCDPAASFVTGVALPVDGGYLSR